MLTNFVAPVYQSLLGETNNIQESKMNVVDILTNLITKYATTDKEIDIYAIMPVLSLLETVIASKIKVLSKNKIANKAPLEFYKEMLYNLIQYHKICATKKKE